jgi:phosphate starvation-inducible PhoH-like protein
MHKQTLEFANNSLLPQLFGEHNSHLQRIEEKLTLRIGTRGNVVTISGEDERAVLEGTRCLQALYERLEGGQDVTKSDVMAAMRMATLPPNKETPKDSSPMVDETPDALHDFNSKSLLVKTKRKFINPRSQRQASYLKMLNQCELVFGVGPAGTGKTYLAVAKAVELLMAGAVERIILSRPAVEAGEHLGFLPGDLKMKVDPYLRPLYDALDDMLPPEVVQKKIESNEIEIAPLAFMRGRTLANAFCILDEAQNATPVQLKMFLTRLGENSRMVVTGDLTQIDLPHASKSGLSQALDLLKDIPEIGITRFSEDDVVRHPLVMKIVKMYNTLDA